MRANFKTNTIAVSLYSLSLAIVLNPDVGNRAYLHVLSSVLQIERFIFSLPQTRCRSFSNETAFVFSYRLSSVFSFRNKNIGEKCLKKIAGVCNGSMRGKRAVFGAWVELPDELASTVNTNLAVSHISRLRLNRKCSKITLNEWVLSTACRLQLCICARYG